MPRKPAIIDIQLNSTVACLTPVLALLNDLLDCFGAPFMQAISNTALNLLAAVQNVKNNKDECVHLMTDIHQILFAIAKLHMQSEPQGSLPPSILYHIGKFATTLHKIHTFVEGQQEKSKFKHFLRQREMGILLKECWAGLQQALEVFKIETGVIILADVLKIQEKTEKLHEELLDLISNMTEGTSDRSSSVYHVVTGSQNSSISFGLLPAKPKIFHGRESELHQIVQTFNHKEAPRLAILGPGGIGKTSLAKAALHHPGISANYEAKLFVACDSATTSIELAALVGSNIGLKPGKDLTKSVVQHFAHGPRCFLVLDNLETSWEPIESRGGIEEFLSLLSEVSHLALIITMRGAERPSKVHWTHPFLSPLKPLADDAARQTFIDITDNDHDNEEITQLLELTDNMPLAVNLLANLVDYEGCSSVLARWKTENTSMLSEGHDKSSNLNSSITISLSCPRMTSGARNLLSLLSILPDGLSNVELLQSDLPVPDILTCKAVLLQTSLAYTDSMRLKVLVPIREYMQHIHPPSPSLVQPLRKHFHSLLDLYRAHFGVQINGIAEQINANLHNIHHILLPCLHPENPELRENIYCILSLSSFRRLAAHGDCALMDKIPLLLPQLADPRLETNFTIEVLFTASYYTIPNPELLIDQAVHHLEILNDPSLASKFYRVAGGYYHDRQDDKAMSLQFYDKALMLARNCGNVEEQTHILNNLAQAKLSIGDCAVALRHAREAEEKSQMCGHVHAEALALEHQAICCSYLGKIKAAVVLCQRGRQLLQLRGMSGGSLDHQIMATQANAHSQKSEYTEAHSVFTTIANNASPNSDPSSHALSVINIATIDLMTGKPEADVQKNIRKATEILTAMRFPLGIDYCRIVLADLKLRERDISHAKELFQAGLNSQWGKNAEAVAYTLARLADVTCWPSAEIKWSSSWQVVYLAHSKKAQLKIDLYKAFQFLGDGLMLQEDEDTAHSLFEVALEAFTEMDIHRSRADCMLRLGDIAKQSGDLLKAVGLWKDARPLFERSSQAMEVAKIDTRLAGIDADILQQHEKSLQYLRMLDAPTTLLHAGIDQLTIEVVEDRDPTREKT
ncbi:hypothetical protein FB451DRAFT_1149734 [Mycena latifolia]|nr:hypothetical protein FB451DRAFT_1149734 [Mycena latifolia]